MKHYVPFKHDDLDTGGAVEAIYSVFYLCWSSLDSDLDFLLPSFCSRFGLGNCTATSALIADDCGISVVKTEHVLHEKKV